MKSIWESCSVRTKGRVFLLILDLKPFRSLIREKHSAGREFQGLATDIDILKKFRNVDRKIGQSIRITSGSATTVRKWDQVNK